VTRNPFPTAPGPRLIVVDADEARKIVESRRPRVDALLSIRDRARSPHRFADLVARRLCLDFDDVLYDLPSGYSAATHSDVVQILAFALAVESLGTVLVHCSAGISRSPAAALLLHAARLGHGREEAAVDSLLRDLLRAEQEGHREAGARPNARMLVLGDLRMRRRGRLVAAALRTWPALLRDLDLLAERGIRVDPSAPDSIGRASQR
jgi:predicted protein tyrosine phosphatase